MIRLVIPPAVLLAVLVAASGLRAADGDIRFSYQVVQNWGGGFEAGLTMTNAGTQTLTDWRLTFSFDGQIASAWNGVVLSAADGTVTVGPASWNGAIAPGGSVTVGFTATPGDAPDPADMAVTGTWCDACSPTPTPPPGDDDYRVTANRDGDAFTLGRDEPLQVHLAKGARRVFSFDQPVAGVVSRNPTVAAITVQDGTILVTGKLPGRTGLRIAFDDGRTLFMGLRVDNTDGTPPGLPGPVAVGSVSEDSAADLAFWRNHVPGRSGTRLDIRYIYINGGPISGWRSWDPDRAISYAKESLKLGMIPFFVFYNIPDGGESYFTDLEHLRDAAYMRAYYENLSLFLSETTSVMQGELYGVILEPDLLGYMQQNSGLGPGLIATADGTLVDTVTRINRTIAEQGDNVTFGWQLNLWAKNEAIGPRGVIRRTDDLGFTAGREVIVSAARDIVAYALEAGVASHGAGFLSIDKYGLDAGVSSPDDPSQSTWFWNNDHWLNYLLFVRTMGQTSGLPTVLWQLPVGRINASTATSARTGQAFPDLPNASTRYEDSSATFFLGDVFTASNPARLAYFSQNTAQDPALSVDGQRVAYGGHMGLLPEHGVIAALFGAGVGDSTDGVGDPPTDDYFWIQKVQDYYLGLPAPAAGGFAPGALGLLLGQ